MLQNRRNYYRTLRVQPDASLDVIKSSYRTLLQKLRMHPDLGGNERNASLINQAYKVLRNPEKRYKYDEQLLKEYSIKQLSSGPIKRPETITDNSQNSHKHKDNRNQRNYYRLLHVQSDSPFAIIESSFNILLKGSKTDEQTRLLREAFDVLSKGHKKEIYDELLLKYEHPEAITLLKQHFPKQLASGENTSIESKKKNLQNLYLAAENNVTKQAQAIAAKQTAYIPTITQYCSFCKTPHSQSPCPEQAPLCMECSSPLFPPTKNFLNQARRELTRFKASDPVAIYYDWPGNQERSLISDISPTGICIHSKKQVDTGLIIKIDSNEFKAVGKITYSRKQDAFYNTGVRFLTVQFNKQKGQFFSVHT